MTTVIWPLECVMMIDGVCVCVCYYSGAVACQVECVLGLSLIERLCAI